MSKRLNTQQFIEKSCKTHNYKYNYNKTIYVNNRLKVIITCPKHGDFEQNAANHINGQGCPKCDKTHKITKSDFINKSIEVHGDIYNYDKVNYENIRTPVTIVCPKHGDFKQTPIKHINKGICPDCRSDLRSTNNFINKSKIIHKKSYNYNKTNYINSITKVIITCPKHGDFKQIPYAHLSGQGCPNCDNSQRLDTKKFVDKSNIIHNHRYNYNKTEYKNNRLKVIITCSKHGDFTQTAGNHLNGQGCPKCNNSKGELKIDNILKTNNIKYISQYRFTDLKHKRKLMFDFAIIDNNDEVICLIEFNGYQHYNYVEYIFKNIDNFEMYKYRDELKMKYCLYNNIKLFIIKYNDNIDTEMNYILDYVQNFPKL